MTESKELKAGETTTYDVNGKVLKLKPVTLGKMKKAMEAFMAKDVDTFEMIQNHLVEIFANGENDFATKEWIADNVTLPMANRMIDDMRAINGLEKRDFLKGGATEAIKVERDLVELKPTPSV